MSADELAWRRRARAARPTTARPTGAAWSHRCDWGLCSSEAVAWRYSYRLRDWLPVCVDHREVAGEGTSRLEDGDGE